MIKCFVPPPLPTHATLPLFYFRFEPNNKINFLFKEAVPRNFFEEKIIFSEEPSQADIFILPNNFTHLDESASEYIGRYADMGEKHGKQVFVFSCGDLSDSLQFDPRVRVFKYSLYRSAQRANEISAPTLTVDIGEMGLQLRAKSQKPTVSFCGRADFASVRELCVAWAKRIPLELRGILDPLARARIRGIFWRRSCLRACERSPLLNSLFIMRKTFSGAEKTIELDPVQARKEFIDSLINTDFVLAPKGDGNYSNRFLESLSMGRIPVLLDTDTVLPLESEIDYSKITVRVPMSRVKAIPEFVKEFYDSLSDQQWAERQHLARETYEKFLRQDRFFESYFNGLSS